MKNKQAVIDEILKVSDVDTLSEFLGEYKKKTINDADNFLYMSTLAQQIKAFEPKDPEAFLGCLIENLECFERDPSKCSSQFHVKIELPEIDIKDPTLLIQKLKNHFNQLENKKITKFNNQGDILGVLLKNLKGSLLPYIPMMNK